MLLSTMSGARSRFEKVKFDEEYQRFCIKHGLTRQPIDEKAEKTLRKFDLRIVTRESMTTSVITNLRLKGAGLAIHFCQSITPGCFGV